MALQHSGAHDGVGRRPKGAYFTCAVVAMVPSVRTHSGVSADQMPASSFQGSISVMRNTGLFSGSSASQVATSSSKPDSVSLQFSCTTLRATKGVKIPRPGGAVVRQDALVRRHVEHQIL